MAMIISLLIGLGSGSLFGYSMGKPESKRIQNLGKGTVLVLIALTGVAIQGSGFGSQLDFNFFLAGFGAAILVATFPLLGANKAANPS